MIVMNLEVDNFYAFQNFHMNMSYPKKIVDSGIENEYLQERPNFRYKKVNILMGANATGKTSIGRMLMKIFNFLDKKELEQLTLGIADTSRKASFSIDFVANHDIMYRVIAEIMPKTEEKYELQNLSLGVRLTTIGTRDSYEKCVEKIEEIPDIRTSDYNGELEKIAGLSWLFAYPADFKKAYRGFNIENKETYSQILERTLKALDPSITSVARIAEVENAYVIRRGNSSILMQDGVLTHEEILSSGTKAGIEIAGVMTAIVTKEYGFFYCDEKFSYIHSDIEKACLAVMIQKLGNEEQLFFTTHNADILDMPLPKHTFSFLIKDEYSEQPIRCVSASEFLKRNTDSLRNAADNDLFSAAPSVDLIYQILELNN